MCNPYSHFTQDQTQNEIDKSKKKKISGKEEHKTERMKESEEKNERDKNNQIKKRNTNRCALPILFCDNNLYKTFVQASLLVNK